MPTLVAKITSLRLPDWASHFPSIVSDSPPVCPGAQREYTSAVSMKRRPASNAASSTRHEVGSSSVQPNTFPPRQIAGTSGPSLPSVRVFICNSPHLMGCTSAAKEARGFSRASSQLLWRQEPQALACPCRSGASSSSSSSSGGSIYPSTIASESPPPSERWRCRSSTALVSSRPGAPPSPPRSGAAGPTSVNAAICSSATSSSTRPEPSRASNGSPSCTRSTFSASSSSSVLASSASNCRPSLPSTTGGSSSAPPGIASRRSSRSAVATSSQSSSVCPLPYTELSLRSTSTLLPLFLSPCFAILCPFAPCFNPPTAVCPTPISDAQTLQADLRPCRLQVIPPVPPGTCIGPVHGLPAARLDPTNGGVEPHGGLGIALP